MNSKLIHPSWIPHSRSIKDCMYVQYNITYALTHSFITHSFIHHSLTITHVSR